MDRILVNGFSKKNGIDEAEMQTYISTVQNLVVHQLVEHVFFDKRSDHFFVDLQLSVRSWLFYEPTA